MATQDVLIYWTDGLNPPRRLTLGKPAEQEVFPYPSIQTVAEEEELDINNFEIYGFNSRYRYSIGTNYPLASNGGGALFSMLPRGVDIILGTIEIEFVKQGIVAHASYSIQAGLTIKGTTVESEGINFDYDLCGTVDSPDHGILQFKHETKPHYVPNLGGEFPTESVVILSQRQGGGFLFSWPCIWFPPQRQMQMYVQVSGEIAIRKNTPYERDPRYPTSVGLVYPLPESTLDPISPDTVPFEGEYAFPPTPPNPSDIFEAQNTTGASQTSAVIDLPSGIESGNLLVLAVVGDSIHPGSIAGWEKVHAASTKDSFEGRKKGDLRTTIELFKRKADGTEGASVTINWEGPQNWMVWGVRFTAAIGSLAGDFPIGDLEYSANAETIYGNEISNSAVPDMIPRTHLFQIASINGYNSTIVPLSESGYNIQQTRVITTPTLLTSGYSRTTQNEAVQQSDGTVSMRTIDPDVTFPAALEDDYNSMAVLSFGAKAQY